MWAVSGRILSRLRSCSAAAVVAAAVAAGGAAVAVAGEVATAGGRYCCCSAAGGQCIPHPRHPPAARWQPHSSLRQWAPCAKLPAPPSSPHFAVWSRFRVVYLPNRYAAKQQATNCKSAHLQTCPGSQEPGVRPRVVGVQCMQTAGKRTAVVQILTAQPQTADGADGRREPHKPAEATARALWASEETGCCCGLRFLRPLLKQTRQRTLTKSPLFLFFFCSPYRPAGGSRHPARAVCIR
jgi:hypothetical protein